MSSSHEHLLARNKTSCRQSKTLSPPETSMPPLLGRCRSMPPLLMLPLLSRQCRRWWSTPSASSSSVSTPTGDNSNDIIGDCQRYDRAWAWTPREASSIGFEPPTSRVPWTGSMKKSELLFLCTIFFILLLQLFIKLTSLHFNSGYTRFINRM